MLACITLTLVAVSCGTEDEPASTGADTTVRSFEEVRASDMVFEADSTDTSRGIFRVTTTIPMICAIVWGPDESFGRFNNSLAMNGTGIEQHDVVLPDVEPGVQYRYVVQGTAADGTLYRSAVGSFSIEPVPGTTPEIARGEDLAAAATVVDVSSEFSAAFSATLAIDGDTSTEWATNGDGDDGSITIDLGSDRAIGGVEFSTRAMADGTARTETFTVAVDGGAPLGPFPAGTVAAPRLAEVEATGRLLRFDIGASTGGNVGAVEIGVFGPVQ